MKNQYKILDAYLENGWKVKGGSESLETRLNELAAGGWSVDIAEIKETSMTLILVREDWSRT